jgi:hypothetical protein
MHLAVFLLVSWYILVAGLLLRTWLSYADQDATMTPNQKIASWIMLLIATAFWGVTLPISYLELLKKRSTVSEKAINSYVRTLNSP